MKLKNITSFVLAVSFAFSLFYASSSQAQTCVPPPDDIVAWWPFDETSGTTVVDRVNNKNGSYAGSPIQDSGIVGRSLRFDGVDDYVAIADDDFWNLSDRDFTIEFWVNFDQPGGGTVGHPSTIFIGNDDGPGSRNKWFFALGGGYLNFHINGSSGSSFFPLAEFSPVVGQWYHLAITRNSDTYSIYVDGDLLATETNSSLIPDSVAPLTLGQAEELGFLDGRLDEMSFYNRALLQSELLEISDAGNAGKCKGLSIHPSEGGNNGEVTVILYGSGFKDDAILRLTSNSHPTLEAKATSVLEQGSQLSATFHFKDTPVGIRNVQVINSDGSIISEQNLFSIVNANDVALWIEDVGLQLIRPDRPQNHWLQVGNAGNIDSNFTYALIEISNNLSYKTDLLPGFPSDNKSSPERSAQRFAIGIPPISAGSLISIPITYSSSDLSDYEIRAKTIQIENIPEENLTPQYDIASYPIEWDWKNNPNIPPGYIVFYNEFSGPAGSVAISVGDGNVGHFAHSSDKSLRPDGLVEHPYILTKGDGSLNEPTYVIRPPNWTLEKSQQLYDHFHNADPNLGYDVRFEYNATTGVEEFNSYWDGQLTSYSNNWWQPGEFPNGNCAEGVYHLWPDLQQMHDLSIFELIRVGHIDTELLARLRNYWKDIERLKLDISPKWADWLPDDLYSNFDYFKQIFGISSFDPNTKLGPIGLGQGKFVNGHSPFRYSIFFENSDTATASAQEVVITDQLDINTIDVNTLSLGQIAFGEYIVTPPFGTKNFSTIVDLRPDNDLLVSVNANLDPVTGVLSWVFTSIDPETGDFPEDPSAGFLPPNITPPEGDGSVLFTVMPKEDLPTGTQIRNSASIVFDSNAPIITPVWLNIIDNTIPISTVLPLDSAQNSKDFLVEWSGSDEGSGIRDYSVFVSEDNGPFSVWLSNITATSATFSGENTKTYAFYSVARDLTGNSEFQDMIPDAITTVKLIQQVDIDIKPKSVENSINLGSEGVIPVAILSTETFDAADIDHSSLTLAGASAREKGKSGNIGSFKDVDGDSDLDLVVQFPTADLNLSEADTSATLEGLLYGGIPIRGSDVINVVP